MECIASTQPFIQAFPSDCGAHAAKHVRAPAPNANISFTLKEATGATYEKFITDLRNALTVNSQKVYDIPVLVATATGSARFILVNLTNQNSESNVTIAIDKVDVYIVAYRAGNTAYFLKDVSQEAQAVLFQGIKHEQLHFKGNYDDLERYAGNISRVNIDLGFDELDISIVKLFHHKPGNSVPKAFIVIIQLLAEAARFNYIKKRVWKSFETREKFTPDPAFMSLENRWSNLSDQIQKAQKHGGKFEQPVPLRTTKNKQILVKDVDHDVVKKGMALLLNNSRGNVAMKLIMMMMEEFNGEWEDAGGEFGIDF